ncbi:hypothetical protein [Radicibacter daui]|uniref:hypothetical protein n=1 Tax=Radicibacter daui TaxID=3064829 RepID=UPI004047001C
MIFLAGSRGIARFTVRKGQWAGPALSRNCSNADRAKMPSPAGADARTVLSSAFAVNAFVSKFCQMLRYFGKENNKSGLQPATG